MSDKHRIDAPDTVDLALRFLQLLQAEGWCLASIEHHVDYAQAAKHGRKMPVEATLSMTLVPG